MNWLPPPIHINVRKGTARGANGAATTAARVWRSEVLGQVAMALLVMVAVTYLARLLMAYL